MQDSQANSGWRVLLDLRASGSGPIHDRLRRALRDAIRDGRLPSGARLPPSRVLAADLGCSRWVVTEAYAQLAAEGYVESRTGSGTRVRSLAPVPPTTDRSSSSEATPVRYDLAPGLPDLRAFPRSDWAKALRLAATGATVADLGYADPLGHAGLRGVLLEYLQRSRSAAATGVQVRVTTGTTSAVLRTCRALVATGHTTIAVEDPGWPTLAAAAREAGLQPVPVRVDDRGLRVDDLAGQDTRAVLIAPAHQFPRGVVLAPDRRRAILQWARDVRGLVLEDDYDAEFRYDRKPVSTLQGMDPSRVVLLGSLSKTLSPALRMGWMVTPGWWGEELQRFEAAPPLPATLDQLALAHLLTTGAYDRHLRRMRRTLRARRDLLVELLERQLPTCRTSRVAAGLHLVLELPAPVTAGAVVRECRRRGLKVADLDTYRTAQDGEPGLVLGYGNIGDAVLPQAVRVLADVVDGAVARPRP